MNGNNNVAPFSRDEITRYSRHLLLPQVGRKGQERMKKASVLIVGAGGLGSPAALYLAAAGIGRLGVVDYDFVELTNLQRQVLYDTEDIGQRKADRSAQRLRALNPEIEILSFSEPLTSNNAIEVLESFDLVVDGTDNFPTRYLLNDACVLLDKPYIYGSIYRFEGQASVFFSKEGPCYRCIFPTPPPPELAPSCAEGGVLGVLPGVIGTIQAIEALKIILKIGDPLIGRLLRFDAMEMRFRETTLRKDPECPICGKNPTIKTLIDYYDFCGTPLKQEPVETEWDITPAQLQQKLNQSVKPILLDVRRTEETTICRLPGALCIPYEDLPDRLHELDPEKELVIYCKMGIRSVRALNLLLEAGFRNVANLKGGIMAWAAEVDKDMPVY